MAQFEKINPTIGYQDFNKFANSIPDVIARFDRQLRHIYVNRAAEIATGRSKEQTIGKTNRELGVPEELLNIWNPFLLKLFETGIEDSLEFEFHTPDGPRYYSLKGVPEKSIDNQISSVIVISRDITEQRKKYEENILAAKYTAATHLCDEIAHQINNPLAILYGSLFLLEKRINDLHIVDKTVSRKLEKMNHSLERISEITRSMSSWTSHDKTQSPYSSIQLEEIIALALTVCDQREKTIGVKRYISSLESIQLQSQVTDLIEALLPILMNAFEAAKNTPDPWIKIWSQATPDRVEIFIQDSGTGVSRQDFDQMLLPFYTSKGPKAAGTGLTHAKSALSRLRGSLTFEDIAVNTTFKIILPKEI